jgi:hypothetical protein
MATEITGLEAFLIHGKLCVGMGPAGPYARDDRPRVVILYGSTYFGKSGHFGRIRTVNARSERLHDDGFAQAENLFAPVDPAKIAKVECQGGDTETNSAWHEHYEWCPRERAWTITSLSDCRARDLASLRS